VDEGRGRPQWLPIRDRLATAGPADVRRIARRGGKMCYRKGGEMQERWRWARAIRSGRDQAQDSCKRAARVLPSLAGARRRVDDVTLLHPCRGRLNTTA
jgi:hypothetical protein